ncbi:AraC family transcriptional regulator [uncultured Algibacter sp.]|uniref:AraC family transcriptional regulator n=1 Tax=uncultured Algibacter sp. TaxID=298659 RepID=UPI00261BB1EA|nr:AraC family transcriptional regulator [uncultured Algibacter sp.]
MKPFFEKVPKLSNQSFFVKKDYCASLHMQYHYHPEFELTLTENSSGKRFVGNSVELMEKDDLVFIGKNLPHCFIEEENDSTVKKNGIPIALTVVQFNFEIFGDSFLELPECSKIRAMVHASKRGLSIYGETSKRIKKKMIQLVDATYANRLVLLLEILNILSESDEYRTLSSGHFTKQYHTVGYHRLNEVYNFMIQNFKNDIQLKQVAEVANLSETAFCRFFKKRTLKTFKEVLAEMRINYASDLIRKNELQTMSIQEVAEASGFHNISNFNRQFKKIMHKSPSDYAKQFNASASVSTN